MELTPEEKITLETYNRIAQEWAIKLDISDFWKDELEIFEKLIPSGKILEIGAGHGRDAKELIKRGYEYVGTDPSTNLLAIARKGNLGATFFKKKYLRPRFSKRL